MTLKKFFEKLDKRFRYKWPCDCGFADLVEELRKEAAMSPGGGQSPADEKEKISSANVIGVEQQPAHDRETGEAGLKKEGG